MRLGHSLLLLGLWFAVPACLFGGEDDDSGSGGGRDGGTVTDGGGGGGGGGIGAPCGTCADGLTCMTNTPGGYCSRTCTSNSDCGDGAWCYGDASYAICLAACVTVAECRSGYECTGDPGATVCFPRAEDPVTDQFINGDFEQGPGVGWIEEPAGLIIRASELGISATSGVYLGWMGHAQDDRHQASLTQTVNVPANMRRLLFNLWIESTELCDPPWWDQMGLYANGNVLELNDRLCSQDSTDGWVPAEIDISAYSGTRVSFMWEIFAQGGDPLASTVVIDDVRLAP